MTRAMPAGGPSGAERGRSPAEAEPGGLGEAALGAVDLAQLAAEPDLAAGTRSAGTGRPVATTPWPGASARSAPGS